jgi:hypothetical protein
MVSDTYTLGSQVLPRVASGLCHPSLDGGPKTVTSFFFGGQKRSKKAVINPPVQKQKLRIPEVLPLAPGKDPQAASVLRL